MYQLIYTKFMDTFNVPEIEYETPGRDWDDDGLTSWYIEKGHPTITEGMLYRFILLYLTTCKDLDKESFFIVQGEPQQIECEILSTLINFYEDVPQDLKETFRQCVLDIIEEEQE